MIALKCKRIIENKGARIEPEAAVLPLVDPGFFIVPLKTASLYKMCHEMYNAPHVDDRPSPVRAHPLQSRNALVAPRHLCAPVFRPPTLPGESVPNP